MSSELMLILDDASGQFNYSGGQWTPSTLVQWYNETSYYPAFAGDATQFGSFTLTFEGTSIAFIGNTPQTVSPLSQLANVTIDGGQPYGITYGDLDPPSYIQWYQSPTLADGSHTISVDRLAGTAVDFALINVGSKTSLSGKTIFVDDNNPAIHYAGKWTQNTDRFIAGALPHGYPAGNTTHRSSTPGDTITFHFSGSSLSVYGIFSWADLGILSAAYSLDGNTVTNTYPVTTSTPQYVNNDGEASNFLMFSDNFIQPGDHTLVINIAQCINQTFMLDYITYSPSFSSLATMPKLPDTAIPAANSLITTTQPRSTSWSITQPMTQPITQPMTQPIAQSTAQSITQLLTSQSLTQSIMQSTTQSPTAPQTNSRGNGTRAKTGAIVGGVVGGLTIIVIVIFLLLLLRRRRGKGNDSLTHAQTRYVRVVTQRPPLPSVLRRGFTTMQMNPLSPFRPGLPTHHGSGSAIDLKRSRANFENQQRSSNIVASPLRTGPQNDRSSRSDAQSSSPTRADLDTRNVVDLEPPSYDALPTNHPSRRAADNY